MKKQIEQVMEPEEQDSLSKIHTYLNWDPMKIETQIAKNKRKAKKQETYLHIKSQEGPISSYADIVKPKVIKDDKFQDFQKLFTAKQGKT